MPLPADPGQPWPPRFYAPFQDDAQEAAAWYAGDPAELGALYGGAASTSRTSTGGRFSRFWSRRTPNAADSRQRIHVPLAADVAATSADLLFGADPEITIPEAHGTDADPTAEATEARLVDLGERLGLTNTLLEAAEIAAGIGGVYLRPGWDHDVADHPLLDVVHADAAVPEFRWGVLTAVTFWRIVSEDNSQVVRHLERHEPGVVFHGLFSGTKDRLGVRVDLADDASTVGFRAKADPSTGAMALPAGVDGLAVRYVPNALPNRKHRRAPIGRSDCAGTESVMDALDETFTSWMRDIRLGQARLIVPDEFLKKAGRGKGSAFDLDQEIFTPLDMDPAHAERAGISDVQFAIRFEEHAATAAAHVERVVQTAGYSPQTFGLATADSNGQMTATEVRAREGKTMRTRARKQRYWRPNIEAVLWNLLVFDQAEFGGGVPFRPRVEFSDMVGEDPHRTAETIDLLRRAQAASTLTLVAMRSPELEGDELAAEVARIQAENGLQVNDPTGGLPAGPDDGGMV